MTRAMLTGADFATGSPLYDAPLDERRARAAKAIDGWKKTPPSRAASPGPGAS